MLGSLSFIDILFYVPDLIKLICTIEHVRLIPTHSMIQRKASCLLTAYHFKTHLSDNELIVLSAASL